MWHLQHHKKMVTVWNFPTSTYGLSGWRDLCFCSFTVMSTALPTEFVRLGLRLVLLPLSGTPFELTSWSCSRVVVAGDGDLRSLTVDPLSTAWFIDPLTLAALAAAFFILRFLDLDSWGNFRIPFSGAGDGRAAVTVRWKQWQEMQCRR